MKLAEKLLSLMEKSKRFIVAQELATGGSNPVGEQSQHDSLSDAKKAASKLVKKLDYDLKDGTKNSDGELPSVTISDTKALDDDEPYLYVLEKGKWVIQPN